MAIVYPEETYDGELARVITDSSGFITGIYNPNGSREPSGIVSAQPNGSTGNTDLIYGSNNISGSLFSGREYIATIGDSIAEQTCGSTAYRAKGIVAYMLCYLGWPWDYSPSDNFAVSGTTLSVIVRDQVPLFSAAAKTKRYNRVFISAGTNDTNIGRSLSDIKADYLALFSAIRSGGAIPVMWGILPRGADGAITDAKRINNQINEWLFSQSRHGLLEFVDISETFADNSTAFGNCISGFMFDGLLHPSDIGAAHGGKALADYYNALGIVPKLRFASQQSDQFDRVNNPYGVAFNSPNPLLIGGTTSPTGMTTSGGTWSKVSRTLENGQARSDPSCVLAASATHYLYDDWVALGAWSSSQLQPGDRLEARALVEISSGVGITNVILKLSENNGGGAISYECLSIGSPSGLPDGNHLLYLKTPPCTIREYNGSGNAAMFVRLDIVTSSGSGTATIKAFESRKI